MAKWHRNVCIAAERLQAIGRHFITDIQASGFIGARMAGIKGRIAYDLRNKDLVVRLSTYHYGVSQLIRACYFESERLAFVGWLPPCPPALKHTLPPAHELSL